MNELRLITDEPRKGRSTNKVTANLIMQSSGRQIKLVKICGEVAQEWIS